MVFLKSILKFKIASPDDFICKFYQIFKEWILSIDYSTVVAEVILVVQIYSLLSPWLQIKGCLPWLRVASVSWGKELWSGMSLETVSGNQVKGID